MDEKSKKADTMLGIIRKNFSTSTLLIDIFKLLHCSLVRSHLEYANSVYNYYNKEAKVQVRATALASIIGFEKLLHTIMSASLSLPQSTIPTSSQHRYRLSWFSACLPLYLELPPFTASSISIH